MPSPSRRGALGLLRCAMHLGEAPCLAKPAAAGGARGMHPPPPVSSRHPLTPCPLCPPPSSSSQEFVERATTNTIGRQLMYWLYCDANGGFNPSSVRGPWGRGLLEWLLPDLRAAQAAGRCPPWAPCTAGTSASPTTRVHSQPAALTPADPHRSLASRRWQISVFEMARILATMLDGGSEEYLFHGGAGQFIELMAKVRCAPPRCAAARRLAAPRCAAARHRCAVL